MDSVTIRILSAFQVEELKKAFYDKDIHKIGYTLETGKIFIEYSGGTGPNDWDGVMNTMAIPIRKEEETKQGWKFGDD